MITESYFYRTPVNIRNSTDHCNSSNRPRYCASCERYILKKYASPSPAVVCLHPRPGFDDRPTKNTDDKLWDRRWERWWGYNWAREQRKSTKRVNAEAKDEKGRGAGQEIDSAPCFQREERRAQNSGARKRYVASKPSVQESQFFPPLPRAIQADKSFSDRIRQITRIGKCIEHDLIPEMHREYLNLCYKKIMATPCASVNNITGCSRNDVLCDAESKVGATGRYCGEVFRRKHSMRSSSNLESWVRIDDSFTSSEQTPLSGIGDQVRSTLSRRDETPYEDKLEYLERRISMLEEKQTGAAKKSRVEAEAFGGRCERDVTKTGQGAELVGQRTSLIQLDDRPADVLEENESSKRIKLDPRVTKQYLDKLKTERITDEIVMSGIMAKTMGSDAITKPRKQNIKRWFPDPMKTSPFWSLIFGRRSKANVQIDDFVLSKSCQLELEQSLKVNK